MIRKYGLVSVQTAAEKRQCRQTCNLVLVDTVVDNITSGGVKYSKPLKRRTNVNKCMTNYYDFKMAEPRPCLPVALPSQNSAVEG